jgi:cytochrome-b5 reductase
MTSDIVLSIHDVETAVRNGRCVVILCDKVWDLTDFCESHPGGADIIWKVAGMDGTLPFKYVFRGEFTALAHIQVTESLNFDFHI